MTLLLRRVSEASALSLALALSACSGDTAAGATGGASSTSGGTKSTGGVSSSTGGSATSGGVSATGGLSASSGAAGTTGGAGGAIANGGAGNAGAPVNGGASNGGISNGGATDAGTSNAGTSNAGTSSVGSCATVPVPVAMAGAGRELHVTTTGNDGNADGSASRPYASLSAAVRSAVAGDTVLVHGGIYALTSAQVLNPNGRAGSPITIRAVDGESVVFDGAAVQLGNYDGLIRVGGSYAVIDGFEVVNSMGGGIQLIAASQVMVRRCRIHNIAFQALGGFGNDIVLQQNEIYDSVTSNTNGVVDIANNGFGWSPAVLSFWTSETMTRSRRWTVENNHIHDNWGECLDALHLEDSVFRGNLLHDCYSVNLYVDNARALRIEGNYIYNSSDKYKRAVGGESAHGIAVGTESAVAPGVLEDITIANNLILSTSVGILYARFSGLGYTGIGIYNNVIANTSKEAVWFDAAGTSSGVARNNVFFRGANNNAVGVNSAGWIIDHNVWPNGGQQGTASLVADPRFTAPGNGGTAPEGFRLSPGSPALSAGTPVPEVPNDYACRPRSSTAPSIGIYE